MRLVTCSFLCALAAPCLWGQTQAERDAQSAQADCEQLRQELQEVKKALRFVLEHCEGCRAALKAQAEQEAGAKAQEAQERAQTSENALDSRTVAAVAGDGYYVKMKAGGVWYVHPTHRKAAKEWHKGDVLEVALEPLVKNGLAPVYRIRLGADKPAVLVSTSTWDTRDVPLQGK